LLTRAGYTFDIEPSGVDETRLVNESPDAFVVRIAMAKATAVSLGSEDCRLVLGADTIVVVDGAIFGKPRDVGDAISMLRRLSGRTHEVLTAVAIVSGRDRRTEIAATRVTLVDLDDSVIGAYVATGESMDKSGAYGVQGIASRFVERVDGSYTNVVGLPMTVVERLFKELDDGV
jgi:septum formation protein